MTLCFTACMTLYVIQSFVRNSASLHEYDTMCMTQKVLPLQRRTDEDASKVEQVEW